MKKTSLAVALPALALTGLLLSGCGIFRSTKAWETAKQESPLQIPPGLDTPVANEALMIPPPGANQPTANGATASVNGNGGTITDGFLLSTSVADAYASVGKALGSVGTVESHDDSAHTYSVSVTAAPLAEQHHGFFHRLFHHHHESEQATGNGPYTVQVSVAGSGNDANASVVRAEGNPAAVVKVVNALKSSLGGH